jgi:hypothetical protein
MAELTTEELPEFFDGDPSRPFDINYSKQLDVHKWSGYPEVNVFVDHIHDTYIKDEYKFLPIKKKHLKVLLLDLYVNWLEDPDRLLGFSRRLSAYNTNSRYNKLHISRTIIQVQDALSDLDLIDWKKGWVDPETARRRNTKVWATEKLIKEFEEAKIERLDIRLDIRPQDGQEKPGMSQKIGSVRVENQEAIVQQETVKDEYGRDQKVRLEYKDTTKVEAMRSVLWEYNALLQHHHIDLCNTDHPYVVHHGTKVSEHDVVDPKTGRELLAGATGHGSTKQRVYVNQDNFVYRVFNNGSWKQGGRFYGGFWQGIPSEYRKYIRIDGFPTVEVDYATHHPVLLYARKGINYWKEYGPDNDPYNLREQFIEIFKWRGYEVTVGGAVKSFRGGAELLALERGIIKKLMLCMVNCKSDQQAIKATADDLRKEAGGQWNHYYHSLTNEVMEPYVKAIRMRHKPIRQYLSQGKSLELQFLDSQITEELVDHFTRRGIPILTVHDSYIIPEEFVRDLRRQMSKLWNRHSGLNDRGVTVDWESEYLVRMADGSSEMIKTKKRMPTFVPTKEIHPLSKRKQYVSQRHKESLKEFKKWRKREDVQERMTSMRLLDPSKQLEVYDYLKN